MHYILHDHHRQTQILQNLTYSYIRCSSDYFRSISSVERSFTFHYIETIFFIRHVFHFFIGHFRSSDFRS
jgi:hypothetical protein